MKILFAQNLPQIKTYSGSAKYQRMASNPLAPLTQDTVSFTGKHKKAAIQEEEIDSSKAKDLNEDDQCHKVNYALASAIHEESKPEAKKLGAILTNSLKSVLATESHPNNPVLNIHTRPKSPESIMQKCPPRKLKNKNEIDKMGDIIGARIVMKSSTQQDFDKVFKELGKMVKNGKLKVLDIENYRLSPEESYVSANTLHNFEKACNAAGLYPKVTSKPQKSGYTGVHVNIELSTGKLAEIQIMGHDMERVKDLEDFYYKKRCNKDIPKKYRAIDEMLTKVLGKSKEVDGVKVFEKLDDFQNKALDKYILDSYRNAREMPAREIPKRESTKGYFLPIPYFLPQELGFENLQKMKDKCDREWKKQSS